MALDDNNKNLTTAIIKDLSNYNIKEKISIGTSGTRLKLWLEKDNNIVLLKIPKVHTSGEATFEDISEYLVYNVFKNFGFSIIPSYLGIYKGLRGSFTFKNENIYELTDYLSSEYIDYDFTKFASRDFTYNIETLSKLLNGNEFWNMMLLDFFIGNSDRHPGNIMIDEKFNVVELIDNGSSLLATIEENDIKDILRDKKRLEANCDSKSYSCIGLQDKRPVRWSELIQIIKSNTKTINTDDLLEKFKEELNKLCNENLISEDRVKLIKEFILYKISLYKKV